MGTSKSEDNLELFKDIIKSKLDINKNVNERDRIDDFLDRLDDLAVEYSKVTGYSRYAFSYVDSFRVYVKSAFNCLASLKR